jgi:para-nitrobenzyl esterase
LQAWTSLGSVLGFVEDNARGFLGVPYAMSPQNESRWQPPVPAIAWSPYIMQALYDPPGCIQECNTDMPPHACPVRTAEDCLFLNVWTPRQDYLVANGPAPVMLFIHGGAFKQGYAGGIDGGIIYDASAVVNQTGAIVVAINYRLGALGFLYGGSGSNIVSNYGLMDQELAMQWVKDNIAAFGGDPTRITLFGQSAGAMSIASHLTRPQSMGLYNAAIMQSDPFALPFRDPSSGLELANVFAKHANCSDGSSSANWTVVEACLMALDADTILNAQLAATTDVLGSLQRLVDIFVPWTPVCEFDER